MEIIALLVLLLLLLLLFFLFRHREIPAVSTGSLPVEDTVLTKDTAAPVTDTPAVADTVATPVPVVDSPQVPVRRPSIPVAAMTPPDTADTVDTAVTSPDTVPAALPVEKGCGGDTTALWVYPDPSGGLHYRSVEVGLYANRTATIHYQFSGDTGWKKYTGAPVAITATTTLFYDAIDSCGNIMERRSEYYEIETSRSGADCRANMEQVRVGTMNFCIDRYEWPNHRGAVPQSYVSLYQAMDSCYSVGKRLCTIEEWSVACAGPYSWKYPYGQKYEPYACVTHDTMVVPSGSRPECRGFFGIFDMSGNLLEWTSTKAVENHSFYYVTGGFWESGPKSACHDKRYSYYPQNRHNPVGFRCCSDIATRPTSKPQQENDK
jgi:hypothetical protein